MDPCAACSRNVSPARSLRHRYHLVLGSRCGLRHVPLGASRRGVWMHLGGVDVFHDVGYCDVGATVAVYGETRVPCFVGRSLLTPMVLA